MYACLYHSMGIYHLHGKQGDLESVVVEPNLLFRAILWCILGLCSKSLFFCCTLGKLCSSNSKFKTGSKLQAVSVRLSGSLMACAIQASHANNLQTTALCMLLTFRAEKYMCDVLHVYMCEVTQVNGVTVTSTMFVCLDTACMLNSMWTVSSGPKLATFTVSQYFKGCLYHHTDVKLKTCDDSDAM